MCNNYIPVIIFSTFKYNSPTTIICDPKVNLIFFTFTFLAMNAAEWVGNSIAFRSVVEPIISGLNKGSDRRILDVVNRINVLAKRVQISDMILRIVLIIIPTLIGAGIDSPTIII